MNEDKKCKVCGENVEEFLYYILVSEDGEQVIICDYCYQEMSIVKKVNEKWIEYIILNNKKFYMNK